MKCIADKLGRILTPMVTPFKAGTEDVDFGAAEKLADYLVSNGCCDTLILCGTTGEFNTMMYDERVELMRVVRAAVGGRVPVMAGTGAASTREAVLLTEQAAKLELDAVMVVGPYYCKPTQQGVYEHYREVAGVGIDMLLYNIPIFTGLNIAPETVARLAEMKNVRGIKDEAGVNPTQMTVYKRVTPEDFTIYNGDDIMILCGMIQGAAGVVSGSSHFVAPQIRAMIDAFFKGDVAGAEAIHHSLDPLFCAYCPNGRVNPIPLVRAATEMVTGIRIGRARRPLDEATAEEKAGIRAELEKLGVL